MDYNSVTDSSNYGRRNVTQSLFAPGIASKLNQGYILVTMASTLQSGRTRKTDHSIVLEERGAHNELAATRAACSQLSTSRAHRHPFLLNPGCQGKVDLRNGRMKSREAGGRKDGRNDVVCRAEVSTEEDELTEKKSNEEEIRSIYRAH